MKTIIIYTDVERAIQSYIQINIHYIKTIALPLLSKLSSLSLLKQEFCKVGCDFCSNSIDHEVFLAMLCIFDNDNTTHIRSQHVHACSCTKFKFVM